MNTIRKIITAAAASGLMLGAMSATADDTTNGSTVAQQVGTPTGGYSTDATDRGGRAVPQGESPTGISIMDWLRGLMD